MQRWCRLTVQSSVREFYGNGAMWIVVEWIIHSEQCCATHREQVCCLTFTMDLTGVVTGLDKTTLHLVRNYPHILYISCNPDALTRDLGELASTHALDRFAVFDHFAYTPHAECGVYLKAKYEVEYV